MTMWNDESSENMNRQTCSSCLIDASLRLDDETLMVIIQSHRAEIMDKMGILDYHDVIEDHYDTLTKVKDVCFSQADRFRKTVRTRLNPNSIQSFIDNERMAALGLASGALVGVVL